MRWLTLLGLGVVFAVPVANAQRCDKACMERIADQYRAAYVKHDTSLAPFAKRVRFTENNVEMEFPDASWDTVTEEIGPALTLSDPKTGNVGIYTSIMQNDTPGFLAVRLKIVRGKITEVEHMLSTRRNLSGPPTPIGDVRTYKFDPDLAAPVPPEQRVSRERLIEHANGYFSTLEYNTGEIRGTRFTPDATRLENGLLFTEIEKGFKSGRYRFNERVRDRDFFLVDEERGIVMARGFIDHKGVLDEYTLTDGTKTRSVFREPHTWAFLEMFKIRNDHITGVVATFIGAPYFMRSPWTKKPDPVYLTLHRELRR
ncbi:MAG TPA: hypothetical protein VIL32_08685 [Steroidobacteraceae bacterium]